MTHAGRFRCTARRPARRFHRPGAGPDAADTPAPSVPRMTSVHAPDLLLLAPIGVGGAGTVWRAWDRSARRFVAVKIHTGHPARAGPAPDLRHPHLLTGHVDPASGWVAMPLARGGAADRLLA